MNQPKNIFENWNWRPAPDQPRISVVDLHTGGEPLRVFTGGLPEIPGASILEKRRYFRDHYDHIRTGTMWEPRGHADMYGAVITEPCAPGGDFGVFFLHNEGYSTMCGHAMIALATLALDTGLIQREGNEPIIHIDAPPGRVTAVGFRNPATGKVEKVSFRNVPSFVLLKNAQTEVPGLGKVTFDIAYGGAFYAFVDGPSLGLRLDASDYAKLIDYGRRVKHAVIQNFPVRHPFEDDLSFLYGTIFTGPPSLPGRHSRNVCIFADGEVDRSATGSGVSARSAIHYDRGELAPGETITIESILGTCMDVKIAETTAFGPYPAVIPEVSGSAWITGGSEFCFDPADPLRNGFIFR